MIDFDIKVSILQTRHLHIRNADEEYILIHASNTQIRPFLTELWHILPSQPAATALNPRQLREVKRERRTLESAGERRKLGNKTILWNVVNFAQ